METLSTSSGADKYWVALRQPTSSASTHDVEEKYKKNAAAQRLYTFRQRARKFRNELRVVNGPLSLAKRLIKGAPPNILASLAACDGKTQDSLCTYDPDSLDCTPVDDSIPWPICWLLTSMSRKHRLCFGKPLKMEPLVEAASSFVNKVAWRLHFADSPSGRLGFRKFPSCTPHCPHSTLPEFQHWALKFRRVFLQSAMVNSCHIQTENVYGLQRLAFNLLKNLGYAIYPNDKDYGFSLSRKQHLLSLEKLALNPDNYEPVNLSSISFNSLRSQAVSLAKQMQSKLELPGLATSLLRSLSGNMVAHLGLTIKTHKTSVVRRTLHMARSPALQGFSERLCYSIRPHLKANSNFVRDVFEFRSAVHNTPSTPGTWMATADIKEVYLSG